MVKKKKSKRKTKSIVIGHLEKVSQRIFDTYKKQMTDMIKGHHGVYALYRRKKLYYIGLASDFKRRINNHLSDHHKGKWTHFSVYIIRKTDHIREVEALLVRITTPAANYQKGRLKGSKNLRPALKRILTEDAKKVLGEILGETKKPKKKAKKKSKREKTTKGDTPRTTKKVRPLKGMFPTGKLIYAAYKGKNYKAWVYSSGTIKYAKQLYNSPSLAGIAVTKKKTINGWKFWKYKDKNGNLVYIDQLRK